MTRVVILAVPPMFRRLVGGVVRACFFIASVAAALGHATPAIAQEGVATARPAFLSVNQATDVTITVQITDPRLIGRSVNLQQLDATGRVIAVLGDLSDAGTDGDAIAGDGIFTMRRIFSEAARLRVSWALTGIVRRSVSNVIDVTPPPSITLLNPSVVQTGQVYAVAITGQFPVYDALYAYCRASQG